MNKQEFLKKMRDALYGLPQSEIDERISFYSEMIDDRIEDGISETEAVEELGSIEKIVKQIIAETPLTKIAKESIKPKRRLTALEIVLLILGSPIWLTLLIAAASVILSIYVCLWVVIICFWAAFGCIIGCAVGFMLAGVVLICTKKPLSGIALLSAGIICAGLSIFAFFICKLITKGILLLTKKIAIFIKNCFIRKEKSL